MDLAPKHHSIDEIESHVSATKGMYFIPGFQKRKMPTFILGCWVFRVLLSLLFPFCVHLFYHPHVLFFLFLSTSPLFLSFLERDRPHSSIKTTTKPLLLCMTSNFKPNLTIPSVSLFCYPHVVRSDCWLSVWTQHATRQGRVALFVQHISCRVIQSASHKTVRQ